MQTALVIGGTGPTGPYVVNGLAERGYKVTILHTGRHETDLLGPEIEHIHTDPFDVQKTAATCLLYTSPSPRDLSTSRMPSSA